MIWILKDGDEEVGYHYDLHELFKTVDNFIAKEEWNITWQNGELDTTYYDAV